MGNNTNFYNVKDVSLVITSNVPGATNFDAVQSGVEEGSQIGIDGPTDLVTLKEDFTGKYAEFSTKNSRKHTITLSAMKGTPLSVYLSTILEAQRAGTLAVQINAAYKHPLDYFVRNFTGLIQGYPKETIQGELNSLEFTLIGVANTVADLSKKTGLI